MILDWKEYENRSRQAVAEGIVLLKNEGKILPLKKGAKLAVFGRMQNNYYKSGTGSGGMVNVSKVWGILDALKLEDVELDKELMEKYAAFEKECPYDTGLGFGSEPWSQPEMPLDDETVGKAALSSDIAVVIIGRTAGEEQDYVYEPGAYMLSDAEKDMLEKVRKGFKKVILLMNVSAVLDMKEIEAISPDAILYVWQGGEIGGLGTADVLMGRVSPSGHLADSILKNIEDASAYKYFGDRDSNCYKEDIYVGYRYYETFNKAAVMYPFGYGLSYTTFRFEKDECTFGKDTCIKVKVTNTGDSSGKAVVQIYVSQPQGVLGKPALVLCGFAKTSELAPGSSEVVAVDIDEYIYASYDDSGVSGFESSYVLEKGGYGFYFGQNVRDIEKAGGYELSETKLIEKLSRQLAPIAPFERIHADFDGKEYSYHFEQVPYAPSNDKEEAANDIPACLPYAGDKGIKLKDVRDGRASMDEFISQMTDEDLTAIVRGEGMGSPKVTSGTAAAFAGISKRLNELGIPAVCCSDGPSGMRMDCGTRAFSLPSGTLLSCTWNTALNKELYSLLGTEMKKNNIDVLLGPGVNIHRHPLNGRNFEYFSEDPFLTGMMATAQINGLRASGSHGTLKHFCANNQETNRHFLDSVVSERALREIYLKGFEMAVKNGADSVMTTYGAVNGTWTDGRHDLNTCILRNEWGFKGIVMTDWWANIGDKGGEVNKTDLARMVRAQNDFYAVCPEAAVNSSGDNLMDSLKSGELKRGHLARCAANICSFAMNTYAMQRLCGEAEKVELVGFEETENQVDPTAIKYYKIYDGAEIDLSDICTDRGETYVFGVDVEKRGCYYAELTGSSDLSELAQINVFVYMQGIPGGAFSFRGTGGEDMTVTRKVLFIAKYGIIKLYFGNSGLKAKKLKFRFEKEMLSMDWHDYQDYIYG